MVAVATTVEAVTTEQIHGPLPEKSSEYRAKVRNSKSGQPSKQKTNSPSPKSDSDSKSHPKYRLRTTLKRKPTFHELNEGDIKYLWAAYKLGTFGTVKDITPDEFKADLAYHLGHFDIAFSLVADTKKGRIPVGVVGGRFNGPLLFLGSMTWFPWTSKRNIYESVVNTLNELRKKYIILFHSNMDDKDFYVNVARHGIIRRVGTVHDVYANGPAALFETRKPA